MYCFGVGHRLSTLEHMGCFIRELDVCVRWQVAWQGRKKKERDRGGILCSYLHTGVFLLANTSILNGLIVYLQLDVNQLEPRGYFLMEMLSPLRYLPDALIILLGQIIHRDILVTLARIDCA